MITSKFGEYIVQHNSDFSGDVTIIHERTGVEVATLPYSLIKAVTAAERRSKLMEFVESADDDAILNARL